MAAAAERSLGTALALDLLAAALGAGLALPAALSAVAGALSALVPVEAAALGRVAAAVSMGVDPAEGLDREPALRPAARVLARSQRHGSSAAPALRTLARDIRAEHALAAAERARRAGVHVVAPLALCFLPAFVLIAVVPVVLGLASGLR